jgi:CDP-diacylglycerol--serine O-phosphatidyltransferase
MGAMLSGFLSILATVQGIQTSDPHPWYRWSAQLIMLAMILDGLDGNLARWMKGQTEFGAELDTYVDLTAFGIAPAVLVFAVSLQQGDPLLRLLLPSAVALSGVVRLARFKVHDPLRGQAGYAGLPITANAGWVALLVFISHTHPIERFSLSEGPVATLFLAGVVVFIGLQLTSFHYPKPTKIAWMFAPCVVLVVLLFVPHPGASVWAACALLSMGVAYAVLGPVFSRAVASWRGVKEAQNGGPAAGGNGPARRNGT